MDPDTTWKDMLDALEHEEWDRVIETASALLRWLGSGGFPPTSISPPTLGQDWHRGLAKHIAMAVLKKGLQMNLELKLRMKRQSGKRSKHKG